MRTPRIRRLASLAGLSALALGALGMAVPAGAATAPTTYVLHAPYASKAGFPVVYTAAKSSANPGPKNCTAQVEAAYLNSSKTVGLVSQALVCKTSAAATAAFKQVTKGITADKAISLPKSLGATAVATAAGAPEYTIVWQHGSNIGYTGVDTDVPASSSESSEVPAAPLTPGQAKVLVAAAVAQNALLGK